MKSLNKWLFLTYFLVAIAFVLGLFVVYNLLRPTQNELPLATAEIDVSAREIKIPPLLFEEHSAQKIATELDDFVADYQKRTEIFRQLLINQNLPEKYATNQDKKNVSTDEKLIAVVIDDMGVSPRYTEEIISLKKPLTASFLPYAPASKKQVQQAKDAGFEVMLHVPMMPHKRAALAPITLAPEMDKATIQKHLNNFIKYYEGMGITGINNHMGSEFTENAQSLGYVMEILQKNNMFFLDSRTSSKSVVKNVAEKYDVPYIKRDVFLDNENNYEYIMGQLQQAEKTAAKNGYAVAIGHPHEQTFRALRDWVKDVEKRGFTLVHISDLLSSKN